MMQFPSYMTDQRRWMVTPSDANKLPRSPFWQCPPGYKPLPGKANRHWAYQWQNSAVWGTYQDAIDYWVLHPHEIKGLNYVIHPAGDDEKQMRLVCFDFDKCFVAGVLDPAVAELIDRLGGYVEFSGSGNGLHVFVFVNCEVFKTAAQLEVGNCKVDILCSSQVAVTGRVYQGRSQLAEAPAELIDSLRVKAKSKTSDEDIDWWDESYEGISPAHEYLVDRMEKWPTCCRSSKGSTLGAGGDAEFFKAACFLMRHGVVGWEADALLQRVPVDPEPFTEDERQHKLECAWRETQADNSFNSQAPASVFPDLPAPLPKTEEDVFGFKVIPLHDLLVMELKVDFLVDGLFIDKEPMFIGGRQKSQKTNIAADLCYSLASGHPFLGKFPIIEKRRAVFFTAEIGFPSAKNLFDRIRKAKGFGAQDVKTIDVVDQVPSFGKGGDPRALTGLKAYFATYGPQVAVFDPLYLGLGGATVGDLYDIGAILRNIAMLCKGFNIWPIFCHHAVKDRTKEYQPMELGDFYGSGIAEFARQWLLVSHAEPFMDGRASLYARIGGSAAGDRGLWRINIDEGMPDEITERTWLVDVQDEKQATQEGGRAAILEALQHYGTPETAKTLAMFAQIDQHAAESILIGLVKANVGVTVKGTKFQLEGLTDEIRE